MKIIYIAVWMGVVCVDIWGHEHVLWIDIYNIFEENNVNGDDLKLKTRFFYTSKILCNGCVDVVVRP